MKAQDKIHEVMREHAKGKLRSGSKKGPVVKSRKQALAIAYSEARRLPKGAGISYSKSERKGI